MDEAAVFGESGESTFFAPAVRADLDALRRERARFLADPVAMALLNAVPNPILVLNTHRQIVAMNGYAERMLQVQGPEALLGVRPGEAVGCLHAHECPGGCGTSSFCINCGAVRTILQCIQSRKPATDECRITLTDAELQGGALDLRVQSTLVQIGGGEYVIFAMHDISAEKRRRVLERVFLHDLLNTVNNIHSLAQLLTGPAREERLERYLPSLSRFALQIADEVSHHRQLIAAENGDLKLSLQRISLPDFLQELHATCSDPDIAAERYLVLDPPPSGDLVTDVVLLRRVLGNLIKNALEASPLGATITLTCRAEADAVCFAVHNPGCMPPHIQAQVFQRSFSTKAGSGRGIGTYSVRLLGEHYLGGRVGFESTEAEGTTFTFVLPRHPAREEQVRSLPEC